MLFCVKSALGRIKAHDFFFKVVYLYGAHLYCILQKEKRIVLNFRQIAYCDFSRRAL